MRIVVPTGENNGYLSKMGAHFGKAPFYTIITTDENGEIVDVEGITNPGHGAGACGNAVSNILSLKPDFDRSRNRTTSSRRICKSRA